MIERGGFASVTNKIYYEPLAVFPALFETKEMILKSLYKIKWLGLYWSCVLALILYF